MKALLGWGKVLAVILLAIILGEAFKPIKDLEQILKQYEVVLLSVTIGMTALGVILLMGGIFFLILTQGKPMSHEEVEELARRERTLRGVPYTWRRVTYRIKGLTGGRKAHEEWSFREMKEAWRTGTWRTDKLWRRRFVAFAGGLMTVFGAFGSGFVVGPPAVILLVGGALLYAAVRLVWAFWHA